MAYHAIKAGEGDVFLSGGVECVSQYLSWAGAGGADDEARNPLFGDPMARTVETAKTNATWTDPRANGLLPTSTSPWARPPRTSRRRSGSPASARTMGVTSQNRAEKAIANGFFEREITPVTMPDGRVVSTDDGPRPGVTIEGVSGLNPVFRENGTVTAGNCCPLNDGAAAVVVMSDTKAAELGLTPLARVVATGVWACPPRSWAWARSRPRGRRWPAPG